MTDFSFILMNLRENHCVMINLLYRIQHLPLYLQGTQIQYGPVQMTGQCVILAYSALCVLKILHVVYPVGE